jgi:hypothetical protein
LNQLESLNIRNYSYLRYTHFAVCDNQLPPLFNNDLIGTFCPKLTKLSLVLSPESNLEILANCSKFIQQLTVGLFFSTKRSRLKQILRNLDSNDRVQNIICNITDCSSRHAKLLKKYSLKNRNHPSGGTCLIKFRDSPRNIYGRLIWQTETKEKREVHCISEE